MYQRSDRKISTALALTLVLSCISITQSGCDKDKLREARKAAHRIQVVTDAAVDTTATVFHDGVIDLNKKNQIATILVKVNSGNRVLIDKAEAATADTLEVRADLIAQLKVVEDAVKELRATGLLAIKSKNGSLAFDSAINALDSAVAIIQTALGGSK